MRNLSAAGLTAPDGSHWLRIASSMQQSLIPLELVGDPREARHQLASEGVLVTSSQFTRLIEGIEEWCDGDFAYRLGWNGSTFILPSGRAHGPISRGFDVPHCLRFSGYEPIGELEEWKEKVARVMGRSPLGSFALAVMFVPPILAILGERGSVAFDFVGPPGSGKSTLQLLAHSAVGPALPFAGPNYRSHLDAATDIDRLAALGRGLPILLDGAEELAGSGRPEKAILALTRSTALVKYPSVMLSSGTARLSKLAPKVQIEGSWHSIPVDSRNGVLGDRYCKTAPPWTVLNDLADIAQRHHGLAYPRFVEGLVHLRNKDPGALCSQLEADVERFVAKCDLPPGDGQAHRMARHFGIVSAAQKLARRLGALPRPFRKRAQSGRVEHLLEVYRSCIAGEDSGARFENSRTLQERISELACSDCCVQAANAGGAYEVGFAASVRVAGLITHAHRGGRELLIRPSWAVENIDDWRGFRRQLDRAGLLMRDGRQTTVKRKVAKVDLGRVYAIGLPSGDEGDPIDPPSLLS